MEGAERDRRSSGLGTTPFGVGLLFFWHRRLHPCHCTHLFGGCISIHTGAPKLPEIWGFVAWLLLTDLLRTRSRRELLAQGAIGLNYIFHKYLSINAVHHKFSSFSATKMWVKTRVAPAAIRVAVLRTAGFLKHAIGDGHGSFVPAEGVTN